MSISVLVAAGMYSKTNKLNLGTIMPPKAVVKTGIQTISHQTYAISVSLRLSGHSSNSIDRPKEFATGGVPRSQRGRSSLLCVMAASLHRMRLVTIRGP
jgi:hypothetical protein